MPHLGTVLRWLSKPGEEYSGFREQYARARETQADTLADEIVDIADDAKNDYGEDGEPNAEAVARAKLRVDARKWIAAKLKPKKYGDRVEMEHSGTVGHAHLTLDELRQRMEQARQPLPGTVETITDASSDASETQE